MDKETERVLKAFMDLFMELLPDQQLSLYYQLEQEQRGKEEHHE